MEPSPETAPLTWNRMLPETEEIYSRWKAAAARNDGWTEVIWNTTTIPSAFKSNFRKIATENGPVMWDALFFHEKEMKLRGVGQFGVDAQGQIGFVHGGAIATVHDGNTGILTVRSLKRMAVTVSLTISYLRPIPLRSTVLMEATIDKIEGKKVFSKSYLKSPDGATVYSESTAMFVLVGKASL